jgi:rRNA methylase, putative, group 3
MVKNTSRKTNPVRSRDGKGPGRPSERPQGKRSPVRAEGKPQDKRKVNDRKPLRNINDEFKDERKAGEDIPRLEGRNPVIEALKAGRTIEKLLIAKGSHEGSIRQVISLARDKGVVINEVERVKLDAMSETGSHQGVIAIVSPYSYADVDDILSLAREKGEPPFIILLDEIYDPHNLGSMLRTANAAGAHGVIISKRRAVGLTPTVAKASAGAVEYMKVAKVTNIAQTIAYLKEQGIWIVGADMDGDKLYYEANLTGPIAIVVGSEGEGIGKLIKESCDFLVKLPMKGEISSLNAGVAGGILMYEILRQRTLKG